MSRLNSFINEGANHSGYRCFGDVEASLKIRMGGEFYEKCTGSFIDCDKCAFNNHVLEDVIYILEVK